MNPSPNFYFMKPILNPMLFIFIVILSAVSCNKDELFVDTTADTTVIDTPTDSTTVGDGTVNDNNPIVTTTIPCDFSLDTVLANDTVIINCILDLGGQTFNLPTGVSIIYEGGDLINGTLNFSDSSIISGELLNSSVTLGGSTPQLKDATFQFYPGRWEIVEGPTTSDIALRNRNILEDMFLRTKSMGATTFSIDKMDAYFEVSKVTSTTSNQNYYPSEEAINVPSDFNLVMSDNTYLRVQPNSKFKYSLLAVRNVANVTIRGGNLFGDRDQHDYSDTSTTQEWGYLIHLHAAVNTIVDGVKMYNATGDGLEIQSLNFTFQPDYLPSNNIVVKNCYFEANRRSNISITDGYNIIVENNEFVDAGIDTQYSKGTLPKSAFNVEADRSIDSNENYIYYQRASNIIVRNNVERGSIAGGFMATIGDDIVFENNVMENTITLSLTANSKIINNIFNASQKTKERYAITTNDFNSSSVFNNEISGNVINGYNTGIIIYGTGVRVDNNNIKNCKIGISTKDVNNMVFSNNVIVSDNSESRGIAAHLSSLNNVTFINNTIEVKWDPFFIASVNQNIGEENYTFTIENNNTFQSSSRTTVQFANGLNFSKNNSNAIRLYNATNMNIVDNVINSDNNNGIQIDAGCKDIVISSNAISVLSNFECIKKTTNDGINIIISNNNCLN